MTSNSRGFFRAFFIILVLIVAVIWFIPGPLIKWGIEKYGTQAVGAKVDVGSVDFSWLSARLSVEELAVTNPQKPMFNMLALNNIATEVNVGELIAGQVYLNEVAIEGIALDTPRASSGAVPGLAGSSLFGEDEEGFAIPGVALPDTQTLVDQEKEVYEQKIKDVQAAIDAKEQEWKALQESLPDKEKLDAYKARLKELKKNKDPLGRLAALNDLKKLSDDIKKDLKAFDKAKK